MTVDTTSTRPLAVDEFYVPLKERVIAATGLSYYRKRDDELVSHLARRCDELHIANCRDYLRLLDDGADGEGEMDRLIEALTIGETHFFRHPEMFQALRQTILPEVIERNRQRRRLRIWSAGSSIGAEAYTVSIVLHRCFAEQIRDWDVVILGTDINRSYLSQAARAQFESWTLRGTSDDVKEQCFTRRGEAWELKPEYKQGVSFLYHNLAKHACPSLLHDLTTFDVVLCRNVMIYFSPDVVRSIVENLRRCLVDGGWLLVGHAEHNPETFRNFEVRTFDGLTAYVRREPSAPAAVPPAAKSAGQPGRVELAGPRGAGVGNVRHHQPRRRTPSMRLNGASPSVDEPRDELAAVRILADCGQLEAAAAHCRRLVEAYKFSPLCRLYQALIWEQLGDHVACENALRRAIYLDRRFAPAHYYLGLMLWRLSRRDEAVRAWRTVRRVLANVDPKQVLDEVDGVSAADLAELTRMQLETAER